MFIVYVGVWGVEGGVVVKGLVWRIGWSHWGIDCVVVVMYRGESMGVKVRGGRLATW